MSGLTVSESLSLPLDLATEPLGILANRGRGKTYAAHVMVEEIHGAGVPVVILDVKGDWWGVRSSATGKSAGLPVYIFGGDHPDLPLEATAGELVADLIVDQRVSVVLDLSHLSKTKARTFTTDFAERLYHRNRLPLFVVVDEADVLIPQRATAETARLLGAMEDIAKRGRGRGIGMAVVTQRPQEVAKSVLDLMETLILLGMTGPRALASVRDWISVHVDEGNTAAGVLAELPSMKPGEAWVWSPVHGLLRRIKIRRLRTFDSHPTPKIGETLSRPSVAANLDLEALGEQMAATVERAKASDPKHLRAEVARLRKELDQTHAELVEVTEASDRVTSEARALREHIDALNAAPRPEPVQVISPETAEAFRVYATEILTALDRVEAHPAQAAVAAAPPPPSRPTRPAPSRPAPPAAPPVDGEINLRKGARRMVEALARMHPLALTEGQWGTVAKLKTSGGTWSTYRSELTRYGLAVKDSVGWTLTEAGWDYLGEKPEPMTAAELQDHYRTILRDGAGRMLDALMSAYPEALNKTEIGERAQLSLAGGTFSTYLGDLTRNGLAEVVTKGVYRATALLMYGADLPR